MNGKAILLKSGEITLESPIPVSSSDDLAVQANDSLIKEMIGSHSFPHPYRKRDALDFIEMNRMDGSTPFAIDFQILYGGKLAGVIGLKDINHVDRKAHIGYWIGAGFRRKGIATSAVRMVCDYAKTGLGLHRLYTGVFTDNVGSMKVLLNSGFTIEGIAKDDFLEDGKYRTSFHFARIFP